MKIIISMTDDGLVEYIQCNETTNTVIKRIKTLIEVKTLVD